MSKPHKIKLSIPEPCSQDWDKMTPDEKGRFCLHCNKSVIDFRNYTDKELAVFFSKTKGKVCGNLYDTQLNNLIVVQEYYNPHLLHKILLGVSFIAGIIGTMNGQIKTTHHHTIQPIQSDGFKVLSDTIYGEPKEESKNYISGTVTDTSGTPIPFVNMALKKNDRVLKYFSVSNGLFTLEIDDTLIGKRITLVSEDPRQIGILDVQLNELPVNNLALVLHTSTALNIMGAVGSPLSYRVEGKKASKDTVEVEPADRFLKNITQSHLGTPASEEGNQH